MAQFLGSRGRIYIAMLVAIGVGFSLGVGYAQISKKPKLDKYYFDRFKAIKSRMIYGSSVDTKKELEDYQDQTERCMHLDGYNGIEVMDMRCKAFAEAVKEGKTG